MPWAPHDFCCQPSSIACQRFPRTKISGERREPILTTLHEQEMKVEEYRMATWTETVSLCICISFLMRLGLLYQSNEKAPSFFKSCHSKSDWQGPLSLFSLSAFTSFLSNETSPADLTGVKDDNFNGIYGRKYLVHLDDSTFIPYLSECRIWTMVMFYCNDCSFSNDAKRDFALAAEMLWKEGLSTRIRLGTINCDLSQKTCNDAQIIAHPSFSFYYGKTFINHYDPNLPKDKTSFAKYARNPQKPWYMFL